MSHDTMTADQKIMLCDATQEQMDRFEAAARAAGHASGKSAANDHGLWGQSVAYAIAAVSNAPRLMDYHTGEDIREATAEEIEASREAGDTGVILLAADGLILRADDAGADEARRVYVQE